MKTKMKTKMIIDIDYEQQPTGNTCGPACIYMALKYILNEQNSLPFKVEIADTVVGIAEACGTDWIVGTPPDRMEKGLIDLRMKYIEYQYTKNPYDLLKEIILNGNIPILRTITQGIPHWIICNGFDKDVYKILDPWLGIIEYTEEELTSIWSPRDYQFFEVITDGY